MRSFSFAPLALMLMSGTPEAKPAIVEVVGMDYAFRAPATLPAGPVTFRFRNDGKKAHEFNIFR
jgi:hypothetical protein